MKRILLTTMLFVLSFLLLAQVPEWQYVDQIGGIDWDQGNDISKDSEGNIYVTGWFEDTVSFEPYILTSSGGYDIFVAKMDINGNWLWAIRAGGNYGDCSYSIATDDLGNSYITGNFMETATFGSFNLTSCAYADIFVAKIDTDGNWIWAKRAGGTYSDGGRAITVSNNEFCYVTGIFYETATFGSYSLTSLGSSDTFVARIDIDGNWLNVIQAGGDSWDEGYGITSDSDGNCYVTGQFNDSVTMGAFSLISFGNSDIFVAKIDINGNWIWAIQAGGLHGDKGYEIKSDSTGNLFVTGYYKELATFGSLTLTGYGAGDIFIAKLDNLGNWIWVTAANGNGFNYGKAISIDEYENCYIIGGFEETASFDSISINSSGSSDIFVAKINSIGSWLWAINAGGTEYDGGSAIVFDESNNIYVTGWFKETANFGSFSFISYGNRDIFVAKLDDNTLAENNFISIGNLLSNYPNPFNPSTTIEFSIQNESKINLSIYNIKGQRIKTLVNNEFTKGNHSIIWDGINEYNNPVCSGIYYYKLKVNGKTESVKKCLLLK